MKKIFLSLLIVACTLNLASAKVVFQTDIFSSDGTTLTPLYGLVLNPANLSLGVGSTAITGGTSGQCLYDNAGVLGTQACSVGSGLTIGTTTITSGTDKYLLYNNAGVLGNLSTVPIANGGTNATTANAALNNLLPSQTSNSGKFLQTDGSNASWQTVSGGTTQAIGLVGQARLHLNNSLTDPAFALPYSVIEDTSKGYLYVCLFTSPAQVVRVTKSTMTVKDTLTLTSGENQAIAMALDTSGSVLYVGLYGDSAVARINTSTWSEIGVALVVPSGLNVGGIALDTTSGNLYVGTTGTNFPNGPDWLHQISTSSWTVTHSLQGNLAGVGGATNNERGFYVLTLDLTAGFMYVGEDSGNAQIMKVNIPALTRVGNLSTTATGKGAIGGMALDHANGYLYAATSTSHTQSYPPVLSRVTLSSFTVSKQINLPFQNSGNEGLGIDLTNQILIMSNGNNNLSISNMARVSIPSLTFLDNLATPIQTSGLYSTSYQYNYNPTDGYFYTVDAVNGILYQYAISGIGGTFNSKVSSYLTASGVSSGSGVFTLIPFDTVQTDNLGELDVTTNKGRFTAHEAGRYQINFAALIGNFMASSTNGTELGIYVNGSLYQQGAVGYVPTGTTIYPANSMSISIDLNAGDYVDLYFDNLTGTSANFFVTGTPAIYNYMSITRIQ